MKKYIGIVLCAFTVVANASQTAVTDDGKIVILENDYTWKFQSPGTQISTEIKLNKNTFTKDPNAIFMLKSARNSAAIWIDPLKWTFKKNEDGSSAEYKFHLKNTDAGAMIITEGIEVDLENLGKIAVENAKKLAPDIQVVMREYRMVNGVKVLCQQMNGTIQGIKFTYLGYYFSDKGGATQLVGFSAQNQAEKYRDDIEKFLNGFTLQTR